MDLSHYYGEHKKVQSYAAQLNDAQIDTLYDGTKLSDVYTNIIRPLDASFPTISNKPTVLQNIFDVINNVRACCSKLHPAPEHGTYNPSNMCWFDSIIFAMLAEPSKRLHNYISTTDTNITRNLLPIYNYMFHGGETPNMTQIMQRLGCDPHAQTNMGNAVTFLIRGGFPIELAWGSAEGYRGDTPIGQEALITVINRKLQLKEPVNTGAMIKYAAVLYHGTDGCGHYTTVLECDNGVLHYDGKRTELLFKPFMNVRHEYTDLDTYIDAQTPVEIFDVYINPDYVCTQVHVEVEEPTTWMERTIQTFCESTGVQDKLGVQNLLSRELIAFPDVGGDHILEKTIREKMIMMCYVQKAKADFRRSGRAPGLWCDGHLLDVSNLLPRQHYLIYDTSGNVVYDGRGSPEHVDTSQVLEVFRKNETNVDKKFQHAQYIIGTDLDPILERLMKDYDTADHVQTKQQLQRVIANSLIQSKETTDARLDILAQTLRGANTQHIIPLMNEIHLLLTGDEF